MLRKLSKATRSHKSTTARRRKPQVHNGELVLDEEERILREATIHLITKHGMFLVATGARAVRIQGIRIWIITVTLRYGKGDEAYYGDLLYDGEEFTFLTPPEVSKKRAEKLANDPERIRKWNEYRASTLHPGKA